MTQDDEPPHEGTWLLSAGRKVSHQSLISSHLSKEERLLGNSSAGERLPYNDYTTIDWLHDLVRTSRHSLARN